MKKLYILLAVLFIWFIISTFEYRHDYTKDINQAERDTGRIATVKLRSGHIIMFYNDVDTGYFTDAPECPLCIEKKVRDSINEDEKRKAALLAAKKKKDSLTLINNVLEDSQNNNDSI